jgi:hypothetical protein
MIELQSEYNKELKGRINHMSEDKLRDFIEKMQMAIAWRLPRWLVYWALVRAGAYATTGKYGAEVTDTHALSYSTMTKRWKEQA